MSLVVDRKALMTIFGKDSKENELAKLFSGETAIKSSDNSLLYLKKVVAISVSNLLFLRNVLPDISFQKFICDKSMTLNLLCPIEDNNNVSNNVVSNLLSVFVGIEDKYVEKMFISFLYKDTDNVAVTEIYTFHFEYKDKVGVTFTGNKTKEGENTVAAIYTKNSKQLIGNTRTLIRQLQILCMRLDPIPEEANPKVNIRVIYTTDAPSGYQVPGFSTTKVELPTSNAENQREPQLWLGQVATAFHAMKLENEALEGESDYFKYYYDSK